VSLAAAVVDFGRTLRRAGLPVGTGQILDAIAAVEAVGVARREDVYWALAAALVRRREELVVFGEAFDLFFRDPVAHAAALALFEHAARVPVPPAARPGSRRVADAMRAAVRRTPLDTGERERVEVDLTLTASTVETIATKDFEAMTADEIAIAKKAIARMELVHAELPTRRLVADPRGARVDLRRTLRGSLRAGGHDIPLRFRDRARRPPPLVVLCDVSGSMERYSRMALHFVYALARQRARVSAFVFGTRLTHVTRWIAARDVDEALAKVGRGVTDWSGGTRIGESLRAFNKLWSRRVLGQGAVVLLITDGLERDPPELLAREAERLHKSCRRLVWLNPLLRYQAFEPRAAGVRALLPHVDDFRPVHDLASLEDLARSLGPGSGTRHRGG
jgi:uncharacterized protein with von Willebrand factor type A (vWA) domain